MYRNTSASRNVSEHNNITQNCYTVLIGDVQQLLVLLMFEVEDETLNPSQEFCLRHLANCKETSKLGLVRYPPIKVVVQLTNNVYTYYIICQFSSTCLPGNYTLKPLHNLRNLQMKP